MSVEPNEEPLIRWDVAYSPEQMAAAYNRLRAMYDAAEARAVSAERERDELRAAQGWRTIDSAPRDGTPILLYIGESVPDMPFAMVGQWWDGPTWRELGWSPDEISDAGAWAVWSEHGEDWAAYPDVTRWTPLPDQSTAPEIDRQLQSDLMRISSALSWKP